MTTSATSSGYVNSLAIDPTNSQIVYAGTFYGVYKSTNGGTSWTPANSGMAGAYVLCLAIDPTSSQTVYAGTNGAGLFKSTNGGGSWSAVNNGMGASYIYTVVVDPVINQTVYIGTYGLGVYKSTNSGASWTRTNIVTSNGILAISLAIDPANHQTVYVGTSIGIFKSTDGGTTSNQVNNGITTNTKVNCLAVDPANGQTVYAGTVGSGLVKSINGGAMWREADSGVPETWLKSLAIDPSNSQTIYAGSDGGLFKSTNGGTLWTSANSGITSTYVRTIAIDTTNSQTAYIGTGGGGLFKSTNGGASWTAANSGITSLFVNALALDPTNSLIVYAATSEKGIFKSANGGALWTSSNSGISTLDTRALAIDPNNHLTVYAGVYGGGVYRSANGGTSWTAANSGITSILRGGITGIFVISLAIDPTNSQTVYAGTEGGGLFKSTNGGESWTAAGLTGTAIILSLAIDPSNSMTVYAGTNGGGLFKTTNGGVFWKSINNGITNSATASIVIDPNNSQILYAGTVAGVFKIFLSNDVPALPGATNAIFREGAAGIFRLISSGWPTPQFSISGTLPSGVTFDTVTGTLSGSPASGSTGTYPLMVTATNGIPPDANRGITLTVLPASSLAVSITTPGGAKPNTFSVITGTASGSGLFKVEVQITDGTYYLQTDGTFSLTPAWLSATATGTTSWVFTTNASWREGITYTIQARASNGSSTSAPQSSTFTIQVPNNKSSTSLSLTLTPDTLRAGDSTTISGLLVKADNSAVPGQIVTLIITPPSTAATPNPVPIITSLTTSSTGAFTSGRLSLFATPGVYMIQARYEGNSTLAASFSSQALGVTPQSGYAIIISGKTNDNSLLDMHNNTTNSINDTLINKRGFLASNITYLKSTTSAAVTKQQLQDAITVWAKNKLVASPAPLYLFMIDHGTTDSFSLGAQTVTPDDLAGWLNTLESDPQIVSSGTLSSYKRFVIIGTCYSGSFIPKLSKTGRVIISSAASDERSIAGFSIYNSANNNTFSGGEYFIDTMINFLGRGDSFKDAFVSSRNMVGLRDPRVVPPGFHSRVYDTLAQHPLLDDNGDATGSFNLDGSVDGSQASLLTLGVGIKTLGNPADITAVTVTVTIPSTQSGATPLWLKVNDNSRIAKAWMEIRTPNTAVSGGSSSGQIIPSLVTLPLYYDGLQWNGSYTFSASGTYNILYYTQDNQTGDISPAAHSVIYKQLSGNVTPTAFNLISPPDGSGQSRMFTLNWQEVTSNKNLTYSLLVSTDQNFSTIVYKEERIPQAATYIADGKLKNPATGTYYCQSSSDTWCYWKVQAIDSYGAVTESDIRRFTTVLTNALPSLLKGTVTDSNGPVSKATITAGSYTTTTLTNGYYLLAVSSGNYTLSVSLGNQLQSRSITTTPGIVTSNDFILQSTTIQYTVTPSATTGGTISPNTPQTVTSGATTTFTITPDSNYTASVSGCNGTQQAGNTSISYTTGAITANCTVTATFTLTAPTPINGACGTANNTSVTTIPTTNFCTTGTASTVTGSGPWSWNCLGNSGGTTSSCSASMKTQAVKVFMSSGSSEAFTVATSGTTLYGGSNRDVITINTGVNSVTLDQNVERVNLPGTSGSYTFKQTGNLLKIYESNGTTLIVTIPVQGDSDGTQIGFSNGTYDARLSQGQILIGGSVVTPGSPGYIYPVTPTTTTTQPPSAASTAGIYLSNNDVTVSNSGARVFGSGSDALTITTGTNNIIFDQNISKLIFNDAPSNYKLQQTGNMINVYDPTGKILITRGPVQAGSGTRITFTGYGSGYLTISGGGMKLNGSSINPTPTAIGSGVLTP
jgi:photosystem II stability/assembly factor-like uncharacterized protein